MENNLVIGNTSQLSYYFPNNYIKISSRNINYDFLKNNWNSVYITFAKQNVFDNIDSNFTDINTFYTLDLINILLDNSNKIVVYTTCEMFNNQYGPIDINIQPSFIPKKNKNYTNYILSKFLLTQHIKENRKKDKRWEKVIIIHPFNFESVFKNKYFLFGKITNSIINKEIIELGDVNFYRDILHASRMVEESIKCETDSVIGSGKLLNLKLIIKEIYSYFNMDYNYYVKELIGNNNNKINFYYSAKELEYVFVSDMVLDIKKLLENKKIKI
jgi:nucleoside-diphosphate-sugar epimerase